MTDTALAPARKQAKNFDSAPVDDIIGYRLRRAQLAVFQDFMRFFSDLDLRPAEFSVLALIAANPGRKQAEIAAALAIKRANFVALINALDERGLTERRRPAGDKRSHALFLTEKGHGFVARMNTYQTEFERLCVAKLGGVRERDQLLLLLNRLID
jgi:DNA-binding MarR family transcriptional regulator